MTPPPNQTPQSLQFTFWQTAWGWVWGVGKYLLFLWLIDNVIDHTLMYWRAQVFADNLCHALETREHSMIENHVDLAGVRPFGPKMSAAFLSQPPWPPGSCKTEVLFGDVFAPYGQMCHGFDYSVRVWSDENVFPTMRVKYNLLGNWHLRDRNAHIGFLDVMVSGLTETYEPDVLKRYSLFLFRPFVCAWKSILLFPILMPVYLLFPE